MRRVAMISLHTSPLDQPGTGDAGGMNVYVIELSRQLAQAGIEVDVFTRATTSAQTGSFNLLDDGQRIASQRLPKRFIATAALIARQGVLIGVVNICK